MSRDCVFCGMPGARILHENELAVVVRDLYPVTHLHSLIIPRRHAENYFHLSIEETMACHELLLWVKSKVLSADFTVTGFNIGMNCGVSAGQTVFHCHIHLIPRRNGDSVKPRGGVRAVIAEKASY